MKFPLASKVNFFLPFSRPRRACFHLGSIGTAAARWAAARAKERYALESIFEMKSSCGLTSLKPEGPA